ncbi:MAG: AI-2E family transporter [Candidatus Zixiibacteriota bacterium]
MAKGELIKRETVFGVALLAFVVGIVYLFYRIIAPFLVPIAWGSVLVISVYPLHAWLAGKIRRRGLAAAISTTASALLILLPSAYLVATLVDEAVGLYQHLQQGWGAAAVAELSARIDPLIRGWSARLEGVVDLSRWNLQDTILGILGAVSTFAVNHTTAAIANVGRAIFQFLLMLLTMYYLFKDGPALVERVRTSIPLGEIRAAGILEHVTEVVRATIYGGLLVSGIQGALGGCLFWILGLPSPIFWGAVMGFFTLIPLLGAFVIYAPAAVILFLAGAHIKAIILLVVGTLVVSQIDNFLKPMIISGRTAMHPLLLFFAIAGGVAAFGLLGVVLGPVIAAVFVALLNLYRITLREPVATSDPS